MGQGHFMQSDVAAILADVKMDKTLVKGLAILEHLVPAREPVRLADLAVQLGLTKSSVHRLLQTLVRLGYVMPHEGGRYSCSLKLWQIGSQSVEQIDFYRTLHVHLEDLAAESMETVHLALLDGREVVYVDKVEGRHSIRVTSAVGSRAPSYCISTGKVLIAYQAADFIRGFDGQLHNYTQNSITEISALEAELAAVRRNGYAVNNAEWQDGVCGVAAPIWNASGALAAAVGVTVPAMRFSDDDRSRLITLVQATAERASSALGYVSNTAPIQ